MRPKLGWDAAKTSLTITSDFNPRPQRFIPRVIRVELRLIALRSV